MKYRVWWIPQIPMEPFTVNVETIKEGIKIMVVLANYDQFQLDNNIKPDYCNTGGLQFFDAEDTEESPEGSWVDVDEIEIEEEE